VFVEAVEGIEAREVEVIHDFSFKFIVDLLYIPYKYIRNLVTTFYGFRFGSGTHLCPSLTIPYSHLPSISNIEYTNF